MNAVAPTLDVIKTETVVRVLLVEDDEDDQYLIKEAVQALGLPNEVRFFSNGQLALDYLEITAEQPFIILCDINMPIMNGLACTSRS